MFSYYTQPMPQPMPQQLPSQMLPQMPQTAPQPNIAKIVNGFNEITVGDIPTNGMPGFFIKGDYSEIQSRRWTEDGRIEPRTYRVVDAEPQPDPFAMIMQRLDSIEEQITSKGKKKKDDEQ